MFQILFVAGNKDGTLYWRKYIAQHNMVEVNWGRDCHLYQRYRWRWASGSRRTYLSTVTSHEMLGLKQTNTGDPIPFYNVGMASHRNYLSHSQICALKLDTYSLLATNT